MISHGSVYDPDPNGPPEPYRVLVMRYWPRGVRRERVDAWLKEASPSRELIRAYHHEGLDWDGFAQRFREEMAERPDALEALRKLASEHEHLRLLCTERIPPAEHCHRLLLLEMI